MDAGTSRAVGVKGIAEIADSALPFDVFQNRVALEIDTSLFAPDAVFRTCYRFTDRCYLFLSRSPDQADRRVLVVSLATKVAASSLGAAVGDFCNELIDQQLRTQLERDAGPLRELIVAQAFAEGNLLDPQRDEGDYRTDPLGIGAAR